MTEEVNEIIGDLEVEMESLQEIIEKFVNQLKKGGRKFKIGEREIDLVQETKRLADELFVLNNSILMRKEDGNINN